MKPSEILLQTIRATIQAGNGHSVDVDTSVANQANDYAPANFWLHNLLRQGLLSIDEKNPSAVYITKKGNDYLRNVDRRSALATIISPIENILIDLIARGYPD